MANDQISVRIDQATKAAAEGAFNVLGLSATDAIRMLYRQVALQRGLPFPAKIPNAPFSRTHYRPTWRYATCPSSFSATIPRG